MEGINGVRQLMKEAAAASTDFLYYSQNKKKSQEFEEEIPLEVEDQKFLMQGYKYNVWKISYSINVCIRCTVNSYLEASGDQMNLFVLPEWNPKRQTWTK